MSWINKFFADDKVSEVVYDYKGQVSFGRVGGLICLLFAQSMAIAGLFQTSQMMVSYCSTLSLQFLGAAISLYIPSKATETLSKKWAPELSNTVTKVIDGESPIQAVKEAVNNVEAPTTPPASDDSEKASNG